MLITIEYPVTTSFTLTIERDDLPKDANTLLESVTREELSNAPMNVHDIEWGHIKEAWRSATAESVCFFDEENDVIEFN